MQASIYFFSATTKKAGARHFGRDIAESQTALIMCLGCKGQKPMIVI